MQLHIPNFKDNPSNFLRTCGYAFERQEGEELSFVRRLAGTDYPRFHIYAHIEEIRNPKSEIRNLIVNLHLDQKKPSYKGTSAHSGEYAGELVEEEINRIEKLSKTTTPPSPQKLNPW